MQLPKKINPDNLIETIVEIRMNPKCPPELWAGMISANIQTLGYKYVPSPQLSVRLDKNGKMQVPNRLMLKTHKYIQEVKNGNKTNIDNLQGCLVVANSINGKFKEYRGQLKNMKRI